MSSIIPGYEYDIFISYCQQENKHDGWVTEFVDNLKGELGSTFKEEISVYFDINPHDGLLETYDVDESLKEKLKSIIFIPIISRTYCDPKSFAWEHEFKAFVEMASKDQYGLKVKLPNGNVVNRILPVPIHDLDRAEFFFRQAITHDSSFARAYTGLAEVWLFKNYWETYPSTDFLDTVILLYDKALSSDDKLSDAYKGKGICYFEKGLSDKAITELNSALKYNPNDYQAYSYLARVYAGSDKDDFAEGILNMHNALIRYRGTELADYLEHLSQLYFAAGFNEKAEHFLNEAFSIHRDSARYYEILSSIEPDPENALKMAKRAGKINPERIVSFERYILLPPSYNEEAYLYALKTNERMKSRGDLPLWWYHRFGLACWRVGRKEEAMDFFKMQISYDEESIRLNRFKAGWGGSYYDLAGTYAFLGEKEKAYQYLEEFSRRKKVIAYWWASLLINDPLFESIRHEARYEKIEDEIISRAELEHDRVRRVLQEHGLI